MLCIPMQEIGQNQCEKGGGLIHVLRHGCILRILRYM